MAEALIYVTYDNFEYINYFNLFVNEEWICRDLPYERLDELFTSLSETNYGDATLKWCIVSDENVTEWDFINDFEKYRCKLNAWEIDVDSICSILSKHLGGQFSIKSNDIEDSSVQRILVLYPICPLSNVYSESKIDQKELINKASEILNSDSVEKTFLAKIIEKKYAKMKGNR